MAEGTRLNNGSSVQVGFYQQEALNLCFFPTSLGEEGKSSVTLLSRKIGHYHPRKAPVLVLRAAPPLEGFWVSVGWPVDILSPGTEEGYECEGGFSVEQIPGT